MLVYPRVRFWKNALTFVHYDLPDDIIYKVPISANVLLFTKNMTKSLAQQHVEMGSELQLDLNPIQDGRPKKLPLPVTSTNVGVSPPSQTF